jgi:hypothetical protein
MTILALPGTTIAGYRWHQTAGFYRCDNLTRDHNVAGSMCFDFNGNAIFPVFSAKLRELYGTADRHISLSVSAGQSGLAQTAHHTAGQLD